LVGQHVHASVDAFLPGGGFENDLQSVLVVTGPLPGGDRREVPMRQAAPGRYQADFELDGYGSFLLRADHYRLHAEGKRSLSGVSFGQISQPYPGEYARLEPDHALLERAALATGGRLSPPLESVFDPQGQVVTSREPLWQRFILAAIVCFLLDLLLRRVRLFDRQFQRRPRRALGTR